MGNIIDFVHVNADLLAIGIAIAAIALLGFVVYFNDRESVTNRSFFYFALINVIWSISNYLEYRFTTTTGTLWALRIHLFLSTWYALLFFRLAYVFPRREVAFPSWYWRVIVPFIMGTSLLTLTPLVFSRIAQLAPPGYVTNPERGPGMIVFVVMAFGLLILGIISLFRKTLKTKTPQERRQMLSVLIGMTTTAILILVFNVVLPVIFNNLGFIPLAGLFLLPFIALTSYAIYRQKLFNLKVAATVALVFVLAALTFVEVIFTTGTPLLIFRISILAFILIAGVQLIRSVQREIELREHIEFLAENLRQANEKLKELDKLKSQFLSIASHDLRAPLTVIRNFMSLLLEGTYGKLPAAGQEGLQQVFDRATDMAKSVDTYLNVSRIEQGKMKYDFIEVELLPLVKNAVVAFKTNADKKGLAVRFTASPELEGVKAKLDVAKINEVLNNLLDNAIKYTPTSESEEVLRQRPNVPKGLIDVSVEKRGVVARITVKDTGIGMSTETIRKLFQLFSTAENSRKTNTSSTGVGLYITKAHVEAHGGKLWAESEGEGKGSGFILELPVLGL